MFVLRSILLGSILFVTTVLALKREDCEGKHRENSNYVCSVWRCYNWPNFLNFSVCFGVLEKFSSSLSDESKNDHKQIEEEFKRFCRNAKNRENRFVSFLISVKMRIPGASNLASNFNTIFYPQFQCYYLGGLEESATGILSELSKPLTYSLPVEKICEKLKKKDAQICDLRYGLLL